VLPESHNEPSPQLLIEPAIGTVVSNTDLTPTKNLWHFNVERRQDLDLFCGGI
jgi:hypothetical protein